MTKTDYSWENNPLSLLFSARVRLSEDERQELKDAHNSLRSGAKPAPSAPVLQGSSISVETQTAPVLDVYKQYGMSGVVVNDILSSRESISMPVIIKLQKMLGVSIITEKRLKEQFNKYVDYVLNHQN